MEWPQVDSRRITYSINNGVLEASVVCRQGFELRINNHSVQDQQLPQIQQLTARCLGNVWDIKPPHCLGMLMLGMRVLKRSSLWQSLQAAVAATKIII